MGTEESAPVLAELLTLTDASINPSEVEGFCSADESNCENNGTNNGRHNGNAGSFQGQTDDDELIRLFEGTLSDRGRRLWQGITSDYDHDDSRADLALCIIIAKATNGDRARIDAFFRRSGLYRSADRQKKWNARHFSDGRTYGEATIERAIAYAGGVVVTR